MTPLAPAKKTVFDMHQNLLANLLGARSVDANQHGPAYAARARA